MSNPLEARAVTEFLKLLPEQTPGVDLDDAMLEAARAYADLMENPDER